MYEHSNIYAGNIRDKGSEYANIDLYWFGPILDLRPVPKLHLRFQSTILLFNPGTREAFTILQVRLSTYEAKPLTKILPFTHCKDTISFPLKITQS